MEILLRENTLSPEVLQTVELVKKFDFLILPVTIPSSSMVEVAILICYASFCFYISILITEWGLFIPIFINWKSLRQFCHQERNTRVYSADIYDQEISLCKTKELYRYLYWVNNGNRYIA